ncbi:hypothetical protein RFI_00177 [Reticulomyxa filosa]|uniref:Uncharacterized protein n=1 Tax=Reticulomyxa filosa TaxID=46433 RepID=X6PEI7_RETFI|nr:hypothetical protein RFI_00177 [Reticulomyxa filosa]|eukprot:ETO36885.1 hypothetical protein RFI_00177 [Reticulomyxa filosa]
MEKLGQLQIKEEVCTSVVVSDEMEDGRGDTSVVNNAALRAKVPIVRSIWESQRLQKSESSPLPLNAHATQYHDEIEVDEFDDVDSSHNGSKLELQHTREHEHANDNDNGNGAEAGAAIETAIAATNAIATATANGIEAMDNVSVEAMDLAQLRKMALQSLQANQKNYSNPISCDANEDMKITHLPVANGDDKNGNDEDIDHDHDHDNDNDNDNEMLATETSDYEKNLNPHPSTSSNDYAHLQQLLSVPGALDLVKRIIENKKRNRNDNDNDNDNDDKDNSNDNDNNDGNDNGNNDNESNNTEIRNQSKASSGNSILTEAQMSPSIKAPPSSLHLEVNHLGFLLQNVLVSSN